MPDPNVIYLAGPGIFAPGARETGRRMQSLCRRYGCRGLYPLDQPAPEGLPPLATALAIYRADLGLMEQAGAIIADLSPFRGPSADPGTVFELAWMIARGRPALAFSTDGRPLRARIAGARFDAAAHRWTDPDGAEIEDFGLSDNLMIDAALRAGGNPLITPDPGAVPGADLGPLWGVEQCLARYRRQ